MGRHGWQAWVGGWLLVLAIMAGGGNPIADGCDDAILMLVTGVRPGDRFSRQLLTMCQGLREMGGDLNAMNGQAAHAKLEAVLKTWIELDSGLLQNPPAAFRDTPAGIDRMKEIATLLGEVKALIERGDLRQAHDLLEPIVSLMSRLGSLILGQTAWQEFLAAEYRLMTSKPGYRGLDASGAAAGLASFVADLERIKGGAAGADVPLFERVTAAVADLQAELRADPPAPRARVAATYARLSKEFAALKTELLSRNRFGSGPSDTQREIASASVVPAGR